MLNFSVNKANLWLQYSGGSFLGSAQNASLVGAEGKSLVKNHSTGCNVVISNLYLHQFLSLQSHGSRVHAAAGRKDESAWDS